MELLKEDELSLENGILIEQNDEATLPKQKGAVEIACLDTLTK